MTPAFWLLAVAALLFWRGDVYVFKVRGRGGPAFLLHGMAWGLVVAAATLVLVGGER